MLADGRQEAVVCEVGATLRAYLVDGRPVCWGFGADEMSTGGRGQVLAPWPNRLEDGRYMHDGTTAAAALDEPERHNAIHGLVRWRPWELVERTDTMVRMACNLYPQPAYPFTISLTIDYHLVDEGLVVATTVENLGRTSAPFGIGFHNYLHAGEGKVDASSVCLPARRHLVVDDRLLPHSVEPVAGGPLAGLCGPEPVAIGDLVLDDCFTGIEADALGHWRARFVPSGGPSDAVTLWADARFGWATLYSGDTLSPRDRRIGLAVEPMTCPANALRSGEGLAVLAPGDRFAASWGLNPSRLEGPATASR